MQAFFHVVAIKRQQTHKIERHVPHAVINILQFVVASASAAKAKLEAFFLNCQEEMIFRLTLENLGHPQPQNWVHCNNATAIGIVNNAIKIEQSRSMEMRYFWVGDKVAQDLHSLCWYPWAGKPGGLPK
jgi:hypothetical protein